MFCFIKNDSIEIIYDYSPNLNLPVLEEKFLVITRPFASMLSTFLFIFNLRKKETNL